MNSRFGSNWQSQKLCNTDLELVSLVSTGTLSGGMEISYTITYRNNGPRTSYDPKLSVTLARGLQFLNTMINRTVISL